MTLSTKAAISSACLSCFTCSFISCNTSFCSFKILADSSFWSSRAFSNASFFTSTASGLLLPLSPSSFLSLSSEASGLISPCPTGASAFSPRGLFGTLSFAVTFGSTTGRSLGSTGATGSTRLTSSAPPSFFSLSTALTPVLEMFFTTSATSAPILSSILVSTLPAGGSGFLPRSTFSTAGCAGAG